MDLGGCASLVVTLSILIYLAIPLRLYHNINQLRDSDKPLWAVVILILTLVGSIGVWRSVRVIGLNVWHLLFVEKFAYSVTNIFDVITFILAANVCFTLSRTFLKVASSSSARDPLFQLVHTHRNASLYTESLKMEESRVC